MKRNILRFVFFIFLSLGMGSYLFAQVGIGNVNPNADALLDVGTDTSTAGLRLPRVALTGTANVAPLSAHVQGMMVYNTATTGDVLPGQYYNDGSKWILLAGDGWKLTGNAGTTAGTNFLGTTDNISFELFTNNLTRMRIENDGQTSIGFGATAVNANQQFNVGSTYTNGTAIGGYSGGSGIGVYGQNIDVGIGVYGNNAGSGPGLRGESFFGNGLSILGLDGPIWGDNTLFGGDGVVGETTSSALYNGIWGINNDSNGTAILGGNGNVWVLNGSGSGIAASSATLGLFVYTGEGGTANANRGNAAAKFSLDADGDVTTDTGNNGDRASAILAGFDNVTPDGSLNNRESYFGGYFSGGSESSGTPTFAYVGMRYRTNASGTGVNSSGGGGDYKIIGTGSVSTLIKDDNDEYRILFAPEAPEVVFQDYGIGKLLNGETYINLDPLLKTAIFVSEEYPLKVYVTLEGDCNGIYVTDKSIDGFTVKELRGGTSNVSFSWQIVANRADTKNAQGKVISQHVGLRLPVGPGPLKSSKKISKKIIYYNKGNTTNNNTDEKLNEEELKKVTKKIISKNKKM